MKKILCIALPLLMYLSVAAQEPTSMFLEDITGKPFLKMNTEGIEGNFFLTEDWMPGTVTFQNGKTAQVESLRFSPFNNTLYFLRDGQMLEFVEPVKEFEITVADKGKNKKLLFRSGYPAIDKQSTATFYHVMNDDSTQLLRWIQKTIEDYRTYNQPLTQKFIDRDYFYSYKDGIMTKVKRK